MRRIAVINQKGGVGKTTTCANLGAALALAGKSVVLMDLDPQANLSLHLDQQEENAQATVYGVLSGRASIAQVLRPTRTPGLRIVPAHIDLSGAELELASAMGRELILRDAIDAWVESMAKASVAAPDFVLLDCPPSLGLLSVNGLVAAHETIIALQTEFFALQGMTKLLEVVGLLQRRLNPQLRVLGILPSLYDSRLKLAREVLAEIREHFPKQVFARPIAKSVKLAECTSFGQTIFEYAPYSSAAADYTALAQEILGAKASPETLAPKALGVQAERQATGAPTTSPRTQSVPATNAKPVGGPAKVALEITPPQESPRSQRRPARPRSAPVVLPAAAPPISSGSSAASAAAAKPKPRAPLASLPSVTAHLEAPELD